MIALGEYVKVKDHVINIKLPDDFNYKNVEIVIMPIDENKNNEWDSWSEEELDNIGKIGHTLSSFEEDIEDYTKW